MDLATFNQKISVDQITDCWIWLGGRSAKGYGYTNGIGAHRVAWTLHKGPIPSGMSVLHHCDNPPCVNPDHLFLGTTADNVADMIGKGRARASGYRPELPLLPSDVKRRRVIYLSDDEWSAIVQASNGLGVTASSYIRSAVELAGRHIATVVEAEISESGEPPIPAMSQKERDRILRRISKSE